MTKAMEQLADFYREDLEWYEHRVDYWRHLLALATDDQDRRRIERELDAAEEVVAENKRKLARITGQGDA